jgi:fibronectin-binding autotransporter adhesin
MHHAHRSSLATGAALLACSLSPAALGAINDYTTYASWTGIPGSTVLGGQTFGSFTPGYLASASGTAGGVSWSGSATGGFYLSSIGYTWVLGTNIASQTMTFNFTFAGGLSGVAGNFFALDSSFNVTSDTVSILVTLSDSTTQSFSRSISSLGEFWGFHSTGSSIASIDITVAGSGNYSTTDGFLLMSGGSGPAVPLPGAAGLAAIALAGLSRRRRR